MENDGKRKERENLSNLIRPYHQDKKLEEFTREKRCYYFSKYTGKSNSVDTAHNLSDLLSHGFRLRIIYYDNRTLLGIYAYMYGVEELLLVIPYEEVGRLTYLDCRAITSACHAILERKRHNHSKPRNIYIGGPKC